MSKDCSQHGVKRESKWGIYQHVYGEYTSMYRWDSTSMYMGNIPACIWGIYQHAYGEYIKTTAPLLVVAVSKCYFSARVTEDCELVTVRFPALSSLYLCSVRSYLGVASRATADTLCTMLVARGAVHVLIPVQCWVVSSTWRGAKTV